MYSTFISEIAASVEPCVLMLERHIRAQLAITLDSANLDETEELNFTQVASKTHDELKELSIINEENTSVITNSVITNFGYNEPNVWSLESSL